MTVKINSGNPVTATEGVKKAPVSIDRMKGRDGQKSSDRVALSSLVKEFHQNREVASSFDAQRAEKISLLKQQIADGTYQPDLKQVAASLLKYMAKDE